MSKEMLMSKRRLVIHWFRKNQILVALLIPNAFVYASEQSIIRATVQALGAFDGNLKPGEYVYKVSRGSINQGLAGACSYANVTMRKLSGSYAQQVAITVTNPDSDSGEPGRVLAFSNKRTVPQDDELETVEFKPLPLTPSKIKAVKECWNALPGEPDNTPSRSSKSGTIFWGEPITSSTTLQVSSDESVSK
jgi:hypothetical protein